MKLGDIKIFEVEDAFNPKKGIRKKISLTKLQKDIKYDMALVFLTGTDIRPAYSVENILSCLEEKCVHEVIPKVYLSQYQELKYDTTLDIQTA